jgi:hypothetical protein
LTSTIPIVGISLGHRHEKTGISVVERVYVPTGEHFNAASYDERGWQRLDTRERLTLEYRVRHLERHGPPSRYMRAASRVSELVRRLEAREIVLVLDITATGRPVYALIWEELSGVLEESRTYATVCPITVSGTAGGVSKSPDVGYLVPRRDLISTTQILFDEGALKIAEGLQLANTLRDELLAFKSKVTQKPDDLEGWREGKDDDLVLAVAATLWSAERFIRKKDSVPAGGLGYPRALAR